MSEDDYRAVIDALVAELRNIGAPDIADQRHYSEEEPETSERRLISPQRRLVEMLRGFERFLAIQDRQTYEMAMGRMADALRGEGPEAASVIQTTDGEPREYFLSEAPNLREVRNDVQALIDRLLDGDLRPGSEGGTDESDRAR
ncbi:hypothetical protein [Acetobacter syzygii]|uniref:Uncharacterized protein n=1 Tax=Acetobacter syzygii TaxID=146476 RepID=A0A270B4V0_9PROT|nr:hypothetical protein [Acetobacter syzygii]PAL20034.1 hypothetical protein B9K05_13355 [Acetobacter syzygii]PAL20983.1 hypothetical protein B9K04_13230 [Acetobacter syzygii]